MVSDNFIPAPVPLPYYGITTPAPWLRDIDIPDLPRADGHMVWNAVTDFISDPCDAPWHIYLRLLLPLLGAAFLVIITPTPAEIVTSYVEPRKYAGCWRGRRRSRGAARRRVTNRAGRIIKYVLPDVDDSIADRLPGRGYFANRRIGAGEGFFWTIFNKTERLAWWLLLADLSGSVFYAWHSALLRTDWCQASAYQVAKIQGGAWNMSVSTGFNTVPQTGEKYMRNGGIADLSGIIMNRAVWRCLGAWTLRNFGPGNARARVRVVIEDTEALTYPVDIDIELEAGQSYDFDCSFNALGNGQFYVQYWGLTGNLLVETSIMWATQGHPQNLRGSY